MGTIAQYMELLPVTSGMTDRVVTLTAPSAAAAHEVLAPTGDPTDDRLVTIVGRCRVDYDGRAASTLGLGDRLIILKPDGPVLVHTAEQRTPVNWQPPGCTHDVVVEPTAPDHDYAGDASQQRLRIRSVRRTPAETLDIRFTELFQLSMFALADERELDLSGSEEDLRRQILADPALLEEGFTPLMTERDTAAGAVDIYGEDKTGTPMIVELKRRRVGPDAVGQLSRYVAAIERDLSGPPGSNPTVRGVLVAPSLTERAQRLLATENLEHVSLAPDEDDWAAGMPTRLTDFDTEEDDRPDTE